MKEVTREHVLYGYRLLLGREPESEAVINTKLKSPSVDSLLYNFLSSTEFRLKHKGRRQPLGSEHDRLDEIEYQRNTYSDNRSRFWGVNTTLDLIEIILRHSVEGRKAVPGHIVNFLGVAMNVNFMPTLKLAPGSLDQIPIPANYHACMAEWAAMLRAVELAEGTFTCVELGCGWGALTCP